MAISQRKREINQRRHRRKKLRLLLTRYEKATVSEKAAIAAKIRALTPGGEVILQRLGVEEH